MAFDSAIKGLLTRRAVSSRFFCNAPNMFLSRSLRRYHSGGLSERKATKNDAFRLLGLKTFSEKEIEESFHRLFNADSLNVKAKEQADFTKSRDGATGNDIERTIDLYGGISHMLTKRDKYDVSLTVNSSSDDIASKRNHRQIWQIVELIYPSAPVVSAQTATKEINSKTSNSRNNSIPCESGSSGSESTMSSNSRPPTLYISYPTYKTKVVELAERLDPRIWNIGLSFLLTGTSVGIIVPCMPLLVDQLGVTSSQFGLIVAAFGVSKLLGNIPSGHIVDEYGRKPAIVAGLCQCALGLGSIGASVFMPVGMGWQWLMVCRFVSGLGVSLFVAGGSNYLADISTSLNRARTIAPAMAAFSAGAALGPALGGVLVEAIGVPYTYVTVGGLFALSSVVNHLMLVETRQDIPAVIQPTVDSKPSAVKSQANTVVSSVSTPVYKVRTDDEVGGEGMDSNHTSIQGHIKDVYKREVYSGDVHSMNVHVHNRLRTSVQSDGCESENNSGESSGSALKSKYTSINSVDGTSYNSSRSSSSSDISYNSEHSAKVESITQSNQDVPTQASTTDTQANKNNRGMLYSFATAFKLWGHMMKDGENDKLRKVVLLNFLFWLAYSGAHMTLLPMLMISPQLSLNAAQLGSCFAMMSITAMTAAQPIAYISDRYGKKYSISGGLLLLSASMLCLPMANNLPTLACILLPLAVGSSALTSIPIALATDLSPEHQRSQALSLTRTAGDAGLVVGAIAAGSLAHYSSINAAIQLNGVVAAIAMSIAAVSL